MNARGAIACLCLLIVSSKGAGQVASEGGTADAKDYRIAVDVNLVLLHPVVRDRKGEPVLDLREQDFSVFEDGVSQSISLFRNEDTPVAVGLVVDHSGSMSAKLQETAAAVAAFVKSSNSHDKMFVVNFNENISLGLPSSLPFTNDPVLVEAAISRTPAAGMTALYDAVVAGIEQLHAGAWERSILLVISDGGDNASSRNLVQVLELAQQTRAIIYTIGLFDEADPDRNPGVLRRLARETGGRHFFPASLGDVADVCESIARDIRSQYTIGYFSTNAVSADSAYRSVRVVARSTKRGKLVVRTRTGYLPRPLIPPVRTEQSREN